MKLHLIATHGAGKDAPAVTLLTANVKHCTIDNASGDGTVGVIAFGTEDVEVFDPATGKRTGTATVADTRRVLPLDGADALLSKPYRLIAEIHNGDNVTRTTLKVKYVRKTGKPYAEGVATVATGNGRYNLTASVRTASRRDGDTLTLSIRSREAKTDRVAAPRATVADLFAKADA